MDKYLEFSKVDDAKIYADSLHAENVKRAMAQGYTVINNEIVGRNAATGKDMPNAQRTVAWTEIIDNKGGKCLVIDETDKVEFAQVLDILPKEIIIKKVAIVADSIFPIEP